MTKHHRTPRATPPPAPRFDKERWLEAALEVVSVEGQAKLDVKRLAARLGVTKGSFYHHFGSRNEFVHDLLAYWSSAFTEAVKAEVASSGLDARGRLLLLMELIERDGLDRYDLAFRSWAAEDPDVAAAVREVSATRWDYVYSLFKEIGFKAMDTEERTSILLTHYSGNRNAFLPTESAKDPDRTRRLHALLTQPLHPTDAD